jgi:antitoxin (DNA-binding transcriptional repressor) of toxin-antitoxin stability system
MIKCYAISNKYFLQLRERQTMIYQINVAEAKIRLQDLIEAAIKGEAVFILKDDQQAVQLVPAKLPVRCPQFGSAADLVVIADDFDAPLEDLGSPLISS